MASEEGRGGPEYEVANRFGRPGSLEGEPGPGTGKGRGAIDSLPPSPSLSAFGSSSVQPGGGPDPTCHPLGNLP